jgi:hypothetical protein
MHITQAHYINALPILRKTGHISANYADSCGLWLLYARKYLTDAYKLHSPCTKMGEFAEMLKGDPLNCRPWLKQAAKDSLEKMSRDDLLEIYETFHNACAEENFFHSFHTEARVWIKEVLQFIGKGVGIPDDKLVMHSSDALQSTSCSMCGGIIKQ